MLQQQLLSDTQGQVGWLRQVSCHLVKARVLQKEAVQQGSLLGMKGQQGWEKDVGNALSLRQGPEQGEQGEPHMTSTQQAPCNHLSAFSHGSAGSTGGRNSACATRGKWLEAEDIL